MKNKKYFVRINSRHLLCFNNKQVAKKAAHHLGGYYFTPVRSWQITATIVTVVLFIILGTVIFSIF